MSSQSRTPRDDDGDRPAIDDERERAERGFDLAADEAEQEFARREVVGTLSSLAATVVVAAGCVLYYWYAKGEAGLYASGAGALAVVVGAAISSAIPFFVDRSLRPLVRSVGGLLFRAGLPLGVVFWARLNRDEWLDNGMLVTVIAAYVAGWLVEAGWRMAQRNALLRRQSGDDSRRRSKTGASVLL